MKTKKLLAALLALLMAASMLSGLALTSLAYNTPNDIKSVALTLEAPKAGAMVDLSYGSVTCDAPMDYKVIGLHWYKGNETDYLNDRLGTGSNDKYFVGGCTYTVKIELAVKGDKTWNVNAGNYEINATVNGQPAAVSAHNLNPNEKTICVTYVFESIPVGEIIPYVSIVAPVAGQTVPQVSVLPSNSRQMYRASWGADYKWSVYSNGQWQTMGANDTFIAGKDYRVFATFYPNEGFVFSKAGLHTVKNDKYVYGYVNGKQMSMKLGGYDGQNYYSVSFNYDFVSCAAAELNSVSFSGIAAPVTGQSPSYSAPTMGDATYSLVTDDEVSGGAEFGFVQGVAWSERNGTILSAQSTFEQGKIYVLSFFIKTDDIHCFADLVAGSANIGYAEVQPMLEDSTLAFVTVEFAPCGGGVMSNVSVGGFREPVHGASPDSNLFCGQGYEKYGELKWFEVNDSGEREMSPNDAFVYGNRYKIVLVLKATDGFTFAARNALTVNVNGKAADMLAGVANQAESEYVTVVKYFDCAKAPITEVRVTVENPMEGKRPAQQIQLGSDTYIVEGFMFADHETGTVLNPDHVYVGAKNYSVTVTIAAKAGYQIAEDVTAAFINGQQANVIAYGVDKVIFTLVLMAEELPFYGVSFSDGQSFMTKAGVVTLPDYEGIVGEGERFAGWRLADDYSNDPMLFRGEYYIDQNTEFVAYMVATNTHKHIYDNNYIDDGQGMHYRECIDENCPDKVSSVIDQGNHQYVNMDPCEMECFICGHVRTTDVGFGWHHYAEECSEVCPTCGQHRETTHTPGTAATCTDAQKCAVCFKVLVNALGHTPGEAANCGHTQNCTACGVELAPIQGEHVLGAAATCTDAQKCTVCQSELAPAKGHVAGVEWMQDENGHWHICATCNGECERADHTDADEDDLCDVCAYDMSRGLPGWAIALIVVGSVLVLGIGGFAIFWFVIKKKSFADLVAVFKKKK